MMFPEFNTSAAWQADDLIDNTSWVFHLDERAAEHLVKVTRKALDPDRPIFDYRQDECDLGPATEVIEKAVREAHFGCGLSLLKGLPYGLLNAAEYKFLVWLIGLKIGVARPQGKATQYISEVRATGNTYRAAGGRGYNTNSSLDFHADGCDIVALACFNNAKAGGQSLISSSVSAWQVLVAERPDLAEVACQMFYFSRNQEEAPDEKPFYRQPLFDFEDGRLFAKWNRNRVRTAQKLAGVPKLTDIQHTCINFLDEILCRPNILAKMWLEPGDIQFVNNHVMLHSRTEFEDFKESRRKRLLYRLWIAPPDSVLLPNTWRDYFRDVEPGSVRGGIRGHNHDKLCRAFEVRQALSLGMTFQPDGFSKVASDRLDDDALINDYTL
jgi:hypothetical protein